MSPIWPQFPQALCQLIFETNPEHYLSLSESDRLRLVLRICGLQASFQVVDKASPFGEFEGEFGGNSGEFGPQKGEFDILDLKKTFVFV